jgi:HSP20 family protein
MAKELESRSDRMLARTGDPFSGLRRVMDRWFDDFTTDFSEVMPTSMRAFTPQLDLKETADKLVLSAELPGLTDKDVSVEIDNDILTISGEKRSEHKEEEDKGRYVSERTFGSFERSIRLAPDIDREKIDAVVKNGVLTVTLPKSAKAKSAVKKISVH